MQCIIMENTLIKLLHHDETKKRAHDSQIAKAKETLKLKPANPQENIAQRSRIKKHLYKSDNLLRYQIW